MNPRSMLLAVVAAVALLLGAAAPAQAHHEPVTSYFGPSSWYGGLCDGQDNNRSYTGLPNSEPGIALYYVRPFGAYYLLTGPNNRRVVVRHSDKGPAPWTGKLVDLNWTTARALGYHASAKQCIYGYPTWATVRITRLWHAARIRYWARRTATKLDDRWDKIGRVSVFRGI